MPKVKKWSKTNRTNWVFGDETYFNLIQFNYGATFSAFGRETLSSESETMFGSVTQKFNEMSSLNV